MKKLHEMTHEQRVAELVRKAGEREQQRLRYRTWKLKKALEENIKDEVALADTMRDLGANTPTWEERQIATATEKIAKVYIRADRLTKDAEREQDQYNEMVQRFYEMHPGAQLPNFHR